MSDLPEPLIPLDIDLRNMDGFMLNVERLMSSELVAISSGDEFKAAVLLWCRSWKQVPAGSLPNDDRILAAWSGAGPRWKKIRDGALRGFVLCSDGRLYHPVLCEDAIRAWEHKLGYEEARAADRERLRKWREAKRLKRSGNGDETCFTDVSKQGGNSDETSNTGQDRTGQDSKKERKKEREGGKPLNGAYAFAGSVVRLNQADFDHWKSLFANIPNFAAELEARDHWLAEQSQTAQKAWFQSTFKHLTNRDAEFASRAATSTKPRHPDGIIPMHPGAGG